MSVSTGNKFLRLAVDHDLVGMLLQEEWWTNIVNLSHSDKDINIQLRSNCINVYCKMGNLLRIRLTESKKIVCEIHYKYLISAKKSPYIRIYPENGQLTVKKSGTSTIQDILNPVSLKTIKQNILTYAGEEKIIQSRLVEYNKNTIVDVEVAFFDNQSEDEDTRIDLINHDKNIKKLVFIELKHIFDKRLYNGEIDDQIEKYYKFAISRKTEIIDAYACAVETKRVLGITTVDTGNVINDLEPRPILAICGYNQAMINEFSGKIKGKLNKEYLSGLYFFGDNVNLNIDKTDKGNKEVYLDK